NDDRESTIIASSIPNGTIFLHSNSIPTYYQYEHHAMSTISNFHLMLHQGGFRNVKKTVDIGFRCINMHAKPIGIERTFGDDSRADFPLLPQFVCEVLVVQGIELDRRQAGNRWCRS